MGTINGSRGLSNLQFFILITAVLLLVKSADGAEKSKRRGNMVSNRQHSKPKEVYHEFNMMDDKSIEHPNSVHHITPLEVVESAILGIPPNILATVDESAKILSNLSHNVTKKVPEPLLDFVKDTVEIQDTVNSKLEETDAAVEGWFTGWWTTIEGWFHSFLHVIEALILLVLAITAYKIYKEGRKISKFFSGIFGSENKDQVSPSPRTNVGDTRV